MAGWIKLHRKLKEHWLWKDAEKLKWWIDLLLEVNHEEKKVAIKGEVIICQKGQSVRSELSWAEEWRVDRGRVRRFFKMLVDDGMITLKPTSKTTIITICNYSSYQVEQTTKRTTDEQRMNNKRTSNAHKQECKEGKECKEVFPATAGELEKQKFEEFQQWLKDAAPRVAQMKEPFTFEQWQKATNEYGKFGSVLKKMHNHKPLLQNNISAYLTLCNWMRRELNGHAS